MISWLKILKSYDNLGVLCGWRSVVRWYARSAGVARENERSSATKSFSVTWNVPTSATAACTSANARSSLFDTASYIVSTVSRILNIVVFFAFPLGGVWSFAIIMFISLSACFVFTYISQKLCTWLNFTKIYVYVVSMAQSSSSIIAIHYILPVLVRSLLT